MNPSLFTGKLVRLAGQDPEIDPERIARWNRDTEYGGFISVHPMQLEGPAKWRERLQGEVTDRHYHFSIHALDGDQPIGFESIFGTRNQHGDCWVGIGIGDRAYWGRGYGTDAMRLLLQFCFQELNKHRVSLAVLSNNTRAIRSYLKNGFVQEGVVRGSDHRFGLRQDVVVMGILRSEWQAAVT